MKHLKLLIFIIFVTQFFSGFILHADELHEPYRGKIAQAMPSVFSHQLNSEMLKSQRPVYVSLPQSYQETADNVLYPLIVVLDGEFLFHSFSGTAQFLSANSQIPDSIVVGIPNLVDERRNLSPRLVNSSGQPTSFGGDEENYLAFLERELIPYLKQHYRISDFKILVGLSPTANFTLHALWKKPELFNGYIAINAANFKAANYADETLFDKISNSAELTIGTRYVFMSMPEEGAKRNPKIIDDYRELEQKISLRKKSSVDFAWSTIEENAYVAALPAFRQGLNHVFPKQAWDIDYRDFYSEKDGEVVANVKRHFDTLQEKYGFTVLPLGERYFNRSRLKRLVNVLRMQNRLDEAEQLAKYWLRFYPKSASANHTLADVLAAKNNPEQALMYQKKAQDLAAKNSDYRAISFNSMD